jgi:hypothetical protein
VVNTLAVATIWKNTLHKQASI